MCCLQFILHCIAANLAFQDRTRLPSHYLAGCTIHNIHTVGTLDYQLSMSGAYCVLIDNRYSVRIQTLEQYKPCERSVECNALV